MQEDTAKQATRTPGGVLFGLLVLALIMVQGGRELVSSRLLDTAALVVVLLLVPFLAVAAGTTGRVFLSISLFLAALLFVRDPNWLTTLRSALLNVAFFVSFFSALAALRNAAGTSPAMAKAGNHLANQPPGRRYLALTVGTQAFSFVLNYGAIQLLGTLATNSADAEADDRVRRIRKRRMLTAIQRGFISSLPWSPLSFSIAIAVAVIPGTSWPQLVVPGIISSILLVSAGWALDTIFKPAPTGAPRPADKDRRPWTDVLPLGFLLVLMLGLIIGLQSAFEIRVVGVVLIIVPLLSFGWILVQNQGLSGTAPRMMDYLGRELPAFRGEILLIASAGFIGGTASVLAGPMMIAAGVDLTLLPTWALLLGLIAILPLLGQIGANPILSLSLVGPLLPPAEALGLTPTALAAALVCGWTMAGLTSPFTATNLLIGRFGGISALRVGWDWNRIYFPIAFALVYVWSLGYAALTSS